MAMESIPERGSLEETPLPRLLLQLHRARFGGALCLTRERLERSFRFQEGLAITAESGRARETLGQQLVESGAITPEDHAKVASYVEREHCQEGTALLALELIGPRELVQAMKDQVRQRLVECFAWPSGEFRTDGGGEAAAAAQALRADLYAVLQEGIETHWDTNRILVELEPRMGRFPQRSGRFDGVEAQLASDPGVRAYVAALDGRQPLWRVLQNATTPRALATAWVLDATGALDYHDASVNEDRAAAEVVPEIEIRVESAPKPAARAEEATATTQAAGAPNLSPEAEALAREIEYKFQNLAKLTHYDLLGVAPNAAAGEIKIAYLAAAKSYHPDALSRSAVDLQTREQANKVFAAIGTAYAAVSHPRKRSEYDASLRDGEPALDAERLANAETLYRKGEFLMRSGKFKDAIEFLRPAVQLWPDEADYQAGLGWSLFKKLPPEKEAARDHLGKAVELDPAHAQAWYHLSLVLRELGDNDTASGALAQARRIDPAIG
jgi:tetratricopeptide (TPR) repeat protein